MSAKFPCKDCKHRTLGCHSKCEDYLKAKHEHELNKPKPDELANYQYNMRMEKYIKRKKRLGR